MDCVVGVDKDLLEGLHELHIDLAESLGHLAVEFHVGPLLRAAVENHVANFFLLRRGKHTGIIPETTNAIMMEILFISIVKAYITTVKMKILFISIVTACFTTVMV